MKADKMFKAVIAKHFIDWLIDQFIDYWLWVNMFSLISPPPPPQGPMGVPGFSGTDGVPVSKTVMLKPYFRHASVILTELYVTCICLLLYQFFFLSKTSVSVPVVIGCRWPFYIWLLGCIGWHIIAMKHIWSNRICNSLVLKVWGAWGLGITDSEEVSEVGNINMTGK